VDGARTTLPPTLRRIDVHAGMRVVEPLNTVLLIEQCRHVPYPSSLSVIAQNPRLFGIELWPRPQWAATWDALMTERDELKKFREVVMLTVQALCRDAVELAATGSGHRGDTTSGALTQWKQRLLAVSPGERIETPPPDAPGCGADQRNDSDEAPETRLESMVPEYEYLREIIAQCDLVRRRLKSFRVEPEASPVDLWVTDAHAPRLQPETKIKVSKSEDERQAWPSQTRGALFSWPTCAIHRRTSAATLESNGDCTRCGSAARLRLRRCCPCDSLSAVRAGEIGEGSRADARNLQRWRTS
jgi:hypothetical protein